MKKSHNWTARIHFSKTWLQPYQSCSIFPNCSSPRLFHITPMLRVHRIIPYSSSAFLGCSYSPLYSTVRVPYVFWQCAWCLYTFHLSFPGIRLYISHWVSLCRIWLFDLMLRNRLDSTFHIQILIMLPTVQYTKLFGFIYKWDCSIFPNVSYRELFYSQNGLMPNVSHSSNVTNVKWRQELWSPA